MVSHFFYVAASYGAALVIVSGLVLWVAIDGVGRKKDLKVLEDAGIRRRSAGEAK
ncbi:heme exporter protein CcmD [Sinorhizobium sp. BG8]|uniref:heme exporter protein CcmD n=1 Tax=Sinorhizobium sp. BG8 TaxID=2613773 RepID=UPI00193E9EEB|nr:heme exporter protein CcmD [Sinorhizobium sp. BG8]QRM56765.1 heme exporter protein CcmD [Sinorhizobium sp. BG8]